MFYNKKKQEKKENNAYFSYPLEWVVIILGIGKLFLFKF